MVRLDLVNGGDGVVPVTTPAANLTLSDALRGVRAVLLDFDGPVCAVFAGYPAPEVARRVLAALGSDDHEGVTDPLVVLHRAADRSGQQAAARADDVLRAAELDAVDSSAPTPGAAEVIHACQVAGLPVAVVSNNSELAIRRYLQAHGLEQLVRVVAGRPVGRPDLMKPHPYLLDRTLRALDIAPAEALFVGDSTTDIEAAQRASVRVVGYANKPGKAERLTSAGATVVIDHMQHLADAIAAHATR